MTTIEQMKAEIERAGNYAEERRHRARQLKMPSDPAGWLSDLETLMPEKIAELPPHIQDEFVSLFEGQIKTARQHLARGQTDDLWIMIALLYDNHKIVQDNIVKSVAYKAQDQRSSAGFSSGKERQAERSAEWQAWQKEAEHIFHKNKEQSKNQVCIAVAEKFGVSAKAVSNRVNNVGKERRRSKN